MTIDTASDFGCLNHPKRIHWFFETILVAIILNWMRWILHQGPRAITSMGATGHWPWQKQDDLREPIPQQVPIMGGKSRWVETVETSVDLAWQGFPAWWFSSQLAQSFLFFGCAHMVSFSFQIKTIIFAPPPIGFSMGMWLCLRRGYSEITSNPIVCHTFRIHVQSD